MAEGRPAGEPQEEVTMQPHVRMYATATCPYCIRAEQLLQHKGVTGLEKIRVDLEPARLMSTERANRPKQVTP